MGDPGVLAGVEVPQEPDEGQQLVGVRVGAQVICRSEHSLSRTVSDRGADGVAVSPKSRMPPTSAHPDHV